MTLGALVGVQAAVSYLKREVFITLVSLAGVLKSSFPSSSGLSSAAGQ